ncbi:transposable element Tc1 transposase [Trichonephila clavipes]|nr:transposable element Tc1 transposase [Trichonephila clavipes]
MFQHFSTEFIKDVWVSRETFRLVLSWISDIMYHPPRKLCHHLFELSNAPHRLSPFSDRCPHPGRRLRQGFLTSNEEKEKERARSQKLLEQWTREGTHARKTGSGATRKTPRREDRRIVRQALVDPTVTRSTIRSDVGVAIVPQTIFRHLAEANLKSKRSFRELPLTPEHRRLQWCQARLAKCHILNLTDWQKVVFSDESRFVLGTDDNRVRV